MQLNGKTFTYQEFLEWSNQLSQAGQTSGPQQAEPMIGYTALNHKRMERIHKKVEINDVLKTAIDKLEQPQKWVLLTETWCGDSAQNLPVIGKAAEYAGGKIELTIALRDENLYLIEEYVPEQGKGIPRLLVFDEDNQFLAQWGARPEPAQAFIDQWKADPDNVSKQSVQKEMQLWYNKDKHQTLQKELANIITKADKQRLVIDEGYA